MPRLPHTLSATSLPAPLAPGFLPILSCCLNQATHTHTHTLQTSKTSSLRHTHVLQTCKTLSLPTELPVIQVLSHLCQTKLKTQNLHLLQPSAETSPPPWSPSWPESIKPHLHTGAPPPLVPSHPLPLQTAVCPRGCDRWKTSTRLSHIQTVVSGSKPPLISLVPALLLTHGNLPHSTTGNRKTKGLPFLILWVRNLAPTRMGLEKTQISRGFPFPSLQFRSTCLQSPVRQILPQEDFAQLCLFLIWEKQVTVHLRKASIIGRGFTLYLPSPTPHILHALSPLSSKTTWCAKSTYPSFTEQETKTVSIIVFAWRGTGLLSGQADSEFKLQWPGSRPAAQNCVWALPLCVWTSPAQFQEPGWCSRDWMARTHLDQLVSGSLAHHRSSASLLPWLRRLTEWYIGFPKVSFIRKIYSFDHPLSSQSCKGWRSSCQVEFHSSWR